MAKFLISNLLIKPVGLIVDATGNRTIDRIKNPDGSKEYAVCDLINTVYAYDTPKKHVIFEPAFVEMLKPFVCKANGGTAEGTVNPPLPENLKYIQGAWGEWISPMPFFKRYLTDQMARKPSLQNPTGRPAIKAGDFVKNADGSQNVIFSKLEVFTEFYMDPDTGKVNYLKGKTIEALGQQAFANYCAAIQDYNETNAEERGGVTPPPAFTQQQPPVQQPQQPQQPQQQNMQQNPVQQPVQQQPSFTQPPFIQQ